MVSVGINKSRENYADFFLGKKLKSYPQVIHMKKYNNYKTKSRTYKKLSTLSTLLLRIYEIINVYIFIIEYMSSYAHARDTKKLKTRARAKFIIFPLGKIALLTPDGVYAKQRKRRKNDMH